MKWTKYSRQILIKMNPLISNLLMLGRILKAFLNLLHYHAWNIKRGLMDNLNRISKIILIQNYLMWAVRMGIGILLMTWNKAYKYLRYYWTLILSKAPKKLMTWKRFIKIISIKFLLSGKISMNLLTNFIVIFTLLKIISSKYFMDMQ